eukprot:gnl/TRDRNA2_/TRDRNA2_194480_c0_seq1.p1 gnl/TRDRNA2_/TRDRNA2_194480_c0~~gnl/TRDRNA2_/TRDRNA2_194480_c0_seq1.p1  ORF type:complete len:214 (-),score=40.90 gnl/TRDRNA2_/TRDRNA2_194480_c0_seq1:224-865(-)
MSVWHWDQSQIEARAKQVKCNAAGGLESSEVAASTSPTQDLADPYIDNFIAAQQKDYGLKNILMIITRSDNNNTVVYQLGEGSGVINQFWYDITPSYIESHRKSGTQHDKCEFGMLDRQGYGLSVSQKGGDTYAEMTAMPKELKQDFKVVFVDGVPRFLGKVNGKEVYLEKLFIKTEKRWMNPIPKVCFVRVFGIGVQDGKKEMQEVANSSGW